MEVHYDCAKVGFKQSRFIVSGLEVSESRRYYWACVLAGLAEAIHDANVAGIEVPERAFLSLRTFYESATEEGCVIRFAEVSPGRLMFGVADLSGGFINPGSEARQIRDRWIEEWASAQR